jgi:DmsE family decaheme c-type cytochrome
LISRKIIARSCALGVLLPALLWLSLSTFQAVADEDANAGDPEYTRQGADRCLICHSGEANAHLLAIFEGPHGVVADARSPFGSNQCEACHGPGDDHAGRVRIGEQRPPMPAFGPNALWSKDRENETCMNCHREPDHRFWDGAAHQHNDVGCVDCHSSHQRRDPMTITDSQNHTCLSCHTEQRAAVNRAFAHPVRHGQMACADCHQPHGSASDAMLTSLTVNQNCYECHAETRGPFLWEHAPVAEDCTYCHEPHGSNNPAMLTRRAPILCQQCHSRFGHPGVGRTPDDLATGSSPSNFTLAGSCMNCHSQVHGSNHPSGAGLLR